MNRIKVLLKTKMNLMLIVVAFFFISVQGFNIDLNTHVEYRRPTSTLFGFSVAAHKEGDVGW